MITLQEEEQLIKTLSEMAPLDFRKILNQVKENRRIIDSNPISIGFLQWATSYNKKPRPKKLKKS